VADHLGRAYLRYAHTKGTSQEIDHLVAALWLRPGMRVLDVGCGPGRHTLALARRGIACHGVDISARFVEIARAASVPLASFERLDARCLPFVSEFDAVICLCQGGFGMMTADGEDEAVVAGMARALRGGGRLALTAFNAYFAVRYHRDAVLDAERGLAHERTEVRDEHGESREVDLWTGCYTPRELRLLLGSTGFAVERISSVEPGAYGDTPPSVELPELLVVARRLAGPGC
jgi:SAM-dependent methyltransferase